MLVNERIRRWLSRTVIKYGWNTHVRDVLHICQIDFTSRLCHVWGSENILHLCLLFSRDKVIMLALGVESIFI